MGVDCGGLGQRVTGSLATVATSTLFMVAVEAVPEVKGSKQNLIVPCSE